MREWNQLTNGEKTERIEEDRDFQVTDLESQIQGLQLEIKDARREATRRLDSIAQGGDGR